MFGFDKNMSVPQLILDQFPVEIIFNIFHYLTANDILRSFHDFSRYLRQCIHSYDQYKINFKSISKREFDIICRVLQPEQIMSLTLSDDEETPGQIDHFFTRFPTFDQSFTRLEHLRLRNPDEFPYWSQMKCLHTLRVDFKRWPRYTFNYDQLKQFENNLVNIFRLSTLQNLTLNNESSNIDFNFHILPVAENLREFKVLIRTIDHLPTIFKCIPNLQRLQLNLKTRAIENDFISNFSAPDSLTHLTIHLKYGLRQEVEVIIQACKMLTYLNVHIEHNQKDSLEWIDSDWWQAIIEKSVSKLKVFRLKVDIPSSSDTAIMKERLQGFETAFWTDNTTNARSYTINVTPFDELSNNSKQQIVSINFPFNETSINLPSQGFSNVDKLLLSHDTENVEQYIIPDLAKLKRSINDLSTLKHLQFQGTCSMPCSVLNELLTIAPHLTRLTISSSKYQLHTMLHSTYPQIRWLDMNREYVPSQLRTKFCLAFPNLEHLNNCHVYSEEDFEVLLENLTYLQSITIFIQTYYFDSNEEFNQWLTKYTHRKNFAFKLLNPRQIQLWLGDRK
ncbi:hypothetical protein I4U23_015491 [Adineta vaga]|nr:hypothetical protein I4U23_015491 [Adineta vaga]